MRLRRGDVYWVDFEPAVGGEITKVRPAVVVSNGRGECDSEPCTRGTADVSGPPQIPGETFVQLRGRTSKAMADQLQTASKLRFKAFIRRLTDADIRLIEDVVLFQLGITRSTGP